MSFRAEDLRHAQVVHDGVGRAAILFQGRTFDFRAPDDVNNVMVSAVVEALRTPPEPERAAKGDGA